MAKRKQVDDPATPQDESLYEEDTAEDTAEDAEAVAGDEPAAETEAVVEEAVTGPRIKIEDGPFVKVADGDQRQRRLLLHGHNYEHVGDIVDQGEAVWVYRRM